jgi:hypothetical protein
MPVKLYDFKGTQPLITPRLLPLGYAHVAENVKLGSGAMESFLAMGSSVHTPSAAPATVYLFDDTWMDWAARRWIEKASISGTDRILATDGTSYPKTVAEDGTTRRWGVVKPTTALTISAAGTASDDIVVDSISYVYTLVTAYGEESDIYTPTTVVDIKTGEYVFLNNWCVHNGNQSFWLSTTGNDIEYIRVYRLASDSAGNAEYQRVSLRSATDGSSVSEIPVTSITSADDPWYDVNADQSGLSDDLGEVLPTEGWDPPPGDETNGYMKGACMFQNGMYAGFLGKIVYLSVPGFYYAFPASGTMGYTMELPYDVVAIAAFNQSLVVGTTAFPEILSGSDAAYMTRTPLPYQQPCLSAKGMVSLPDGVVYVSPDGLFKVSSSGGEVITKGIIHRDDWQDYDLDSAILAYFDQKIFIFFEGSGDGLIYDPAAEYLVAIDLGAYDVCDVFVDPEADVLYIAWQLSTTYGVSAWEGSTTSYLTAEWQSGIFETPPVCFAGGRVEGTFPAGHSTTLTYNVDGVLKHTQTVTDNTPFRLPSGFRGRDHGVKVVFSKSTINAIYLSFDFGDLAVV